MSHLTRFRQQHKIALSGVGSPRAPTLRLQGTSACSSPVGTGLHLSSNASTPVNYSNASTPADYDRFFNTISPYCGGPSPSCSITVDTPCEDRFSGARFQEALIQYQAEEDARYSHLLSADLSGTLRVNNNAASVY